MTTSFSSEFDAAFGSSPPMLPVTPVYPGNPLLFADEFDALNLWHATLAPNGVWYPGGAQAGAQDNGLASGADCFLVNPFDASTPINDLYTVSNSILSITVKATPSAYAAACLNRLWVTGTMNTSPKFSHQYGYIEFRAKLPNFAGLGGSMWLMPISSGSSPPEIDINEWGGVNGGSDIANPVAILLNGSEWPANGNVALDTNWHTFALDWQASHTTFYMDDVVIKTGVTPPELKVPMYLIITQTTGDSSGGFQNGPILNPSGLPQSSQYDYVRWYTTKPVAPMITVTTGTTTGNDIAASVYGHAVSQMATDIPGGGPADWKFQLATDANWVPAAQTCQITHFRMNWDSFDLLSQIYQSRTASADWSYVDNLVTNGHKFLSSSTVIMASVGIPSWLDPSNSSDQTLFGQLCVAIAKRFVAGGLPITYWEAFNEPNGRISDTDVQNCTIAIAQALKAYNSGYKVGGPCYNSEIGGGIASFCQALVNAGVSPDFISYHAYPSYNTVDNNPDSMAIDKGFGAAFGISSVAYQGTGTPALVPQNHQDARSNITSAGVSSSSCPIFFNEYNYSLDYNDPHNGDQVNSIFSAAMMLGSVSSGANVKGGARWDLCHDGNYRAIIGPDAGAPAVSVTPVGYLFAYLGAVMPGTGILTSVSNQISDSNTGGLRVHTIATKNGSNISVQIINWDQNNTVTGVSIPAFTGTSLNYAEFSPASPNGQFKIIAASSLATLIIPAMSVVVLTSVPVGIAPGSGKVSVTGYAPTLTGFGPVGTTAKLTRIGKNYGTNPAPVGANFSLFHAFADGDVPTGSYVQLRQGDGLTAIPTQQATNLNHWPSGALRSAVFSWLHPNGITAAGGSDRVTLIPVTGSFPTGSAASISPVTAHDYSMQVVIAGVTYTLRLNNEVTLNQRVKVVRAGPAETCWKIWGDFRAGTLTTSNVQGQLWGKFFVSLYPDGTIRIFGEIYSAKPASCPALAVTSYGLFDGASTLMVNTTAFTFYGGNKIGCLDVQGREYYSGSDYSQVVWQFPLHVAGDHSSTGLYDARMMWWHKWSDVYINAFPAPKQPAYAPNSFGTGTDQMFFGGIDAEGGSYWIGHTCATSVAALLKGDYSYLLQDRLNALGGWGMKNQWISDPVTGFPPVVNNTTYTGLRAPDPLLGWGLVGNVQFTGGSNSGSTVGSSHAPNFPYYQYLATGREWWLEDLWENSVGDIGADVPQSGITQRNPTLNGNKYYGSIVGFPSCRQIAWTIRNLSDTEWVTPDTHTMRSYIHDLLTTQYAAMADFITTSARAVAAGVDTATSWAALGIYDTGTTSFPPNASIESPWMHDYLVIVTCLDIMRGRITPTHPVIDHNLRWTWGRGVNANFYYTINDYRLAVRIGPNPQNTAKYAQQWSDVYGTQDPPNTTQAIMPGQPSGYASPIAYIGHAYPVIFMCGAKCGVNAGLGAVPQKVVDYVQPLVAQINSFGVLQDTEKNWGSALGNLAWRLEIAPISGGLPPMATESAEGTSVTTVGPSITDGSGNVYSINASAQVVTNSQAELQLSNVVLLYYSGHQLYVEDNGGTWWTRTNPPALFVATNNPIPSGNSTGTIRTIPYLMNTLFQDNQVPASISPQDVRDLIATLVSMIGTGTTTTPPPTSGTGPGASGNFVNVDFTALTGRRAEPYLWGVASASAQNANFAFFNDPVLVAAAATIKPTVFRMNCSSGLGSTGSDYWTDAVFRNGVGSPDWSICAAFFTTGYKFITKSCRLIVGVKFQGHSISDFASMCGQIATHFSTTPFADGSTVPLWGMEIDNETNLGAASVATYCSYFNPAADAIHAVNPNLVVNGPVTAGEDSGYIQQFGITSGSRAGLIQWHNYGYLYDGSAPVSDANLFSGVNATVTVQDARAQLSGSPAANLPFFLGEYGIEGSGYADARELDYRAAVFAAYYILLHFFADNNFTMGAVWEIWGDTNYGVITDPGKTITPQGYFLAKAGQVMGGPQCSASWVPTGNLQAMAIANGSNIGVLLVNYDTSVARTGQVALGHWPINSSGTGTVNFFLISSNTPSGSLSTLTVTNGMTQSITMPAMSVGIIYA